MRTNRKGKKVCITPKNYPEERFCIEELELTDTGEHMLRFAYWDQNGNHFCNRPPILEPVEWNELIDKARKEGML